MTRPDDAAGGSDEPVTVTDKRRIDPRTGEIRESASGGQERSDPGYASGGQERSDPGYAFLDIIGGIFDIFKCDHSYRFRKSHEGI